MAEERTTPDDEVRRLYEEAEARTAQAMERLVSRDSFGELLALLTENTVALTRIGHEALDLLWTNLRLAGKQDLVRLGRQLGRTEDKLELMLQEVERLRALVEGGGPAPPDGSRSGNGGAQRRRSGRATDGSEPS